MTLAVSAIGFLVLFAIWVLVLLAINGVEKQRPRKTGLTRLVISMTAVGAGLMYFGLAVIRSLRQ